MVDGIEMYKFLPGVQGLGRIAPRQVSEIAWITFEVFSNRSCKFIRRM